MIYSKSKANNRQRQTIFVDFFVVIIQGNPQNNDLRIHKNTLEPTKITWSQFEHELKKKTPNSRDTRDQKSKPCGVGFKEGQNWINRLIFFFHIILRQENS